MTKQKIKKFIEKNNKHENLFWRIVRKPYEVETNYFLYYSKIIQEWIIKKEKYRTFDNQLLSEEIIRMDSYLEL